MDATPITLLERLRTPGDAEAWRRLVELVTPLLLSWGRRVGLSHDDAADLAQDVLAILVRKLPDFQYDPARSFRAWLKTIAMNKWREHRRRPALATLDAQRLADLAAPDAEAAWEREYHDQLVLRAFEAIERDVRPRTFRACWQLLVIGREAAEVAAELGFSPGALHVAKCRILHRLRKELEGLLD